MSGFIAPSRFFSTTGGKVSTRNPGHQQKKQPQGYLGEQSNFPVTARVSEGLARGTPVNPREGTKPLK
jgi:hypothetical protein